MNLRRGDRFKVTKNKVNDALPSYSPSGKKIAYTGCDRSDCEIYTIKAGGGGRVQLTNNNMDDWFPSWGRR